MSTESGHLTGAHQLLRAIGAQSASTLANQVVAFVVPWLVLSRTGSALDAGTVAFATGTAAVVGTLFGGVIVDRIGGRATSLLSDALSLVTVLALPVALFLDALPLWLILVTQTVGVLFDGPGKVARDTLVPSTARHDGVPLIRAASLQETLKSSATLLGPLAAGALVVATGESPTLLVAAGVFVVAMLLVRGVARPSRAPARPPLSATAALRDIREGFGHLLREPLLGPLTLLLTVWVAVYVPLSTIVLPAWFVLSGQSASSLGVFLGALALGSILGGFGFTAIGHRVRPFRWFLVTGVVSKVVLGMLLLTGPGTKEAVTVAFAIGLTGAGQLPIINAAFYSRTPEHLLGRVDGAGWTLVLAALPVASLGFGWLVNATSPAVGIAVIATGSLVMVGVFGVHPAMRLLDDGTDVAPSTGGRNETMEVAA
ncbi:MAG TPA: MFS transporter [Pseudonocardia sp.]|nr:MFS transporter [Pseudonocardia sp.]